MGSIWINSISIVPFSWSQEDQMNVHVCVCVCVWVCVCVFVCVWACARTHMCVHVRAFIYSICLWACACMCAYAYARMCVCGHTYPDPASVCFLWTMWFPVVDDIDIIRHHATCWAVLLHKHTHLYGTWFVVVVVVGGLGCQATKWQCPGKEKEVERPWDEKEFRGLTIDREFMVSRYSHRFILSPVAAPSTYTYVPLSYID